MNFQLFTQSPLLILPLFALFTFLGVFLGVTIRTFMTEQPTVDSAAGLPLAREGATRHDR